jgi:hypothetical protein
LITSVPNREKYLGETVNHPSEDELETYLLGQEANDAQVTAIEEHLLICCLCLDWLQHQEYTVRLMRQCLPMPIVKRERKVKLKTMSACQGWLF